mmetsp:Transcript_44926/g.59633  ORF Transcript_44926/g.59633 Transcript_44926/m.59633 type:complete len:82 (-) Transcript_44926:173-418(-)
MTEGLSKLVDLSKGYSEQSADFTSSFTFMEDTLQERKTLSAKLEQAEKEKQVALEEFKKKEQLLNEFPKILATLEEATQPI